MPAPINTISCLWCDCIASVGSHLLHKHDRHILGKEHTCGHPSLWQGRSLQGWWPAEPPLRATRHLVRPPTCRVASDFQASLDILLLKVKFCGHFTCCSACGIRRCAHERTSRPRPGSQSAVRRGSSSRLWYAHCSSTGSPASTKQGVHGWCAQIAGDWLCHLHPWRHLQMRTFDRSTALMGEVPSPCSMSPMALLVATGSHRSTRVLSLIRGARGP